MDLGQPNAADAHEESKESVLMAEIADYRHVSDEMKIDSPNKFFHDGEDSEVDIDTADESVPDNRHNIPGRLLQPYAGDSSMNSNTSAVASARIRTSTPTSPEYEDLRSDQSDIESRPMSQFEALPTEVSMANGPGAMRLMRGPVGSIYRCTNKFRPGSGSTCFGKPNIRSQAEL